MIHSPFSTQITSGWRWPSHIAYTGFDLGLTVLAAITAFLFAARIWQGGEPSRAGALRETGRLRGRDEARGLT